MSENEPKFTPGPWHRNALAIESEDRYIGTSNSYGANDELDDEANAHLIAAAPEMYAELAYFHKQFQQEHIHDIAIETCQCRTAREWRQVNELLRKARGES